MPTVINLVGTFYIVVSCLTFSHKVYVSILGVHVFYPLFIRFRRLKRGLGVYP